MSSGGIQVHVARNPYFGKTFGRTNSLSKDDQSLSQIYCDEYEFEAPSVYNKNDVLDDVEEKEYFELNQTDGGNKHRKHVGKNIDKMGAIDARLYMFLNTLNAIESGGGVLINSQGKRFHMGKLYLPDTIVFDGGLPTQWYFTSKSGQLLRKDSKKLTYDIITKTMLRNLPALRTPWQTVRGKPDVIAVFYAFETSVSNAHTVLYLTADSLKKFLEGGKVPKGMLQQFVVPAGRANDMIRVEWTRTTTVAERRVNVNRLTDLTIPITQRVETYQNVTRFSSDALMGSQKLHALLKHMCERIAEHISYVHRRARMKCTNLVLYFKRDVNQHVNLLFSDCIVLTADSKAQRKPLQQELHNNRVRERAKTKRAEVRQQQKKAHEVRRRSTYTLMGRSLINQAETSKMEARFAGMLNDSGAFRAKHMEVQNIFSRTSCARCQQNLVESNKKNFVFFSVFITHRLLESLGPEYLLPSSSDVLALLKSVFGSLSAEQLVTKLTNKKLTFLRKPVTTCAACANTIQKAEHHILNDVLDDICRDAGVELRQAVEMEKLARKADRIREQEQRSKRQLKNELHQFVTSTEDLDVDNHTHPSKRPTITAQGLRDANQSILHSMSLSSLSLEKTQDHSDDTDSGVEGGVHSANKKRSKRPNASSFARHGRRTSAERRRLSFHSWQREKREMIRNVRSVDPESLFFDETKLQLPGSTSSQMPSDKEKRVAAWGDAWWMGRDQKDDSDDSEGDELIAQQLAFERAAMSRKIKDAEAKQNRRNSLFAERTVRRSVTPGLQKRHNQSLSLGGSTHTTPRGSSVASSFNAGPRRSLSGHARHQSTDLTSFQIDPRLLLAEE